MGHSWIEFGFFMLVMSVWFAISELIISPYVNKHYLYATRCMKGDWPVVTILTYISIIWITGVIYLSMFDWMRQNLPFGELFRTIIGIVWITVSLKVFPKIALYNLAKFFTPGCVPSKVR
jgi:hypothetical protein